MNIRNTIAGKVVRTAMLLTALISWGCRDNQPLVYETIHEAALKGDLADVKRHLQRGVAVNATDNFGMTPLHWAITSGHKDLAGWLIGKSAEVNATDKKGITPLSLVAAKGNKELAEWLIGKGAKVNTTDKDGDTPLHTAIRNGHADMAELLIANDANTNSKGRNGWTQLHVVAGCSLKAVAELLIAKGADVNAKDARNRTPLFLAANNGHEAVAELLIAKGADVNAKDEDGETPLHAVSGGDSNEKMMEILSLGFKAVESGREADLVGSIITKAHVVVVELLIAKGADVNAKDYKGHSPLWTALKNNEKDVAELLKKHGAK